MARREGNDARLESMRERFNPETKKIERSYINFQGKTIFINKPCLICEKNGKKNRMHFSFECSDKDSARAAYSELFEEMHETETGNYTSHTFHHEAAGSENAEPEFADDDEAGNREGDWY